MKKFYYLFTSLLIAITCLCCESEIIEPNMLDTTSTIEASKTKKIHKSKLQNREFMSESLMYNLIGNDPIRKMQVYTPPGYHHNRAQGYPVVYLLHSLPFSEKSFIDIHTWDEWINPDGMFKVYPDFPQEGFRNWVDNLIATGKMEPMIIVMPNALTNGYGFSFYSNSVLNGNFEDYITTDLVNFMDKRYNTIASKDGRAVIGFSQGGYAAFKFGLKHSDLFSVVASHAGLLLVDAILSLGEVVVAENPGGFTGPDPAKFLTSAGYAMSAAWSPNLNNPPFMVDLPFEHPSGAVIPGVRDRWYQHDVFTLLDTHVNEFKSLRGIYFDCGIYDELGSAAGYPYLMEKLNYYDINYTYKTFEGGHFNKMFSRLEVSLNFCSEHMN